MNVRFDWLTKTPLSAQETLFKIGFTSPTRFEEQIDAISSGTRQTWHTTGAYETTTENQTHRQTIRACLATHTPRSSTQGMIGQLPTP